jgi:hypothetical protein
MAALSDQSFALVAFFPAALPDFELKIVSCLKSSFEFEIFGRWLLGGFDGAGNQAWWLILQNAFSAAFPAGAAAAETVFRSTSIQADSETTPTAGKLH